MADSKEVKMPEAIISDEMIEEMRGKIGTKLRIDNSIFNEEASWLAIKKFAEGVGDTNPLWNDETYAQKTRYGCLIAPPSWVIGVFAGIQFGWRGLGGFHSGTSMEFYKPIRRGDKIKAECIFTGFEGPKPSKFAEKMVIDFYTNNYYNQNEELVSKADWYVIRVERKRAREKGKYSEINLPHPWKEDELKKIEEEILSEKPRGATPRYWEDVEVGEELDPVIKGPFGLTDMIAYISGGGVPIPRLKAHRAQLCDYQRHPAWSFRDPTTYALEPIFAVHYNKQAANAMGLPYPYNAGWQSQTWQIHLLTNWMGDEGWLKKCQAEYRKFIYFSDVVWLKGKIVKKYIDDNGEYCVDIETHGINQRDEDVIPGSATIILPSKKEKEENWPVSIRLK